MGIFEIIVMVVGVGLLLLGGVSGYALFTRALRHGDKFGDETNVGTLWGLFTMGLTIGLLLIWWALHD